ncbi:MAG: FkbM family methyltransferase [Candidatus Acidoferrum typicum]|nr:FkbM family methyltransferase [Candidatus Acidoferrum typicum]
MPSVITAVKNATRSTLRRIGFDLIRYNPQKTHEAALGRLLAVREIDTVLDIGANEGQYATMVRRAGFRGRIISFEPLAEAHSKLRQAAARDPLWTVAPRMALGDDEGTLLMHVAANSASSSALSMLDAHLDAAPESAYIGCETVPVSRLDRVAEEMGVGGRNLFLKIDVQGFEPKVLGGAPRLLDRIRGVQLELSLVPLYDGETLFLSQVDCLARKGFDLWGLMPSFIDKKTGRTLQVDGIFFRPDARSNGQRALEEIEP